MSLTYFLYIEKDKISLKQSKFISKKFRKRKSFQKVSKIQKNIQKKKNSKIIQTKFYTIPPEQVRQGQLFYNQWIVTIIYQSETCHCDKSFSQRWISPSSVGLSHLSSGISHFI